jgi:hypothetical protein
MEKSLLGGKILEMKLREPKKIGICYPNDHIDWAYVTLRRDGDGLDDKEPDLLKADDEDSEISIEEAEDEL